MGLTTTQGIGLCVGDLINFYVDPKMEAKPYTAVACNVDVLKHVVESPSKSNKRRRRRTTSSQTKQKHNQIREWKKFLLNENLEDSKTESDDDDPEYIPPLKLEDFLPQDGGDCNKNETSNDLVDLVKKIE